MQLLSDDAHKSSDVNAKRAPSKKSWYRIKDAHLPRPDALLLVSLFFTLLSSDFANIGELAKILKDGKRVT